MQSGSCHGDNLRFFKKLYLAKGDFVIKSHGAFVVNKWGKVSGCGSSDCFGKPFCLH